MQEVALGIIFIKLFYFAMSNLLDITNNNITSIANYDEMDHYFTLEAL